MRHTVLAVAFSLWLSVSTVTGRTILIDDEGPADFNDIQAAIDNSTDNDITQVTPGTYSRQFNQAINLKDKDIIVRCCDPLDTYELTSISSDPNVAQAHLAFRRSYVPNELIVKFKKTAADILAAGISEGKQIQDLQLSDSLDKLNKKYKTRAVRALFKGFKRNRQRINSLPAKDKALLTKQEERILRRLKRAPEDVIVPDLDRIYKIELAPEGLAIQAVKEYSMDVDVEYAELNYVVYADLEPNDPLYPVQWPLNNIGQMYPESGVYNPPPGIPDCDIDAPEAWDIHIGSSEIIVAVLDTGIDYTHRDLQDNIWINEAEQNGITGFDDDGNECVDDIYGYDFINNDSDPKDDHGHGTHCSGIIAAKSNNELDISGVCWKAKIMGLKFLGSSGSGPISDAVEAFYYAVKNGADVISNSWSGGYVQSAQDAVDYAYSQGVIITASAGNSGDTSYHYPANYEHVISVASTDSNDGKASSSTYGDWVDIAAPGVDILSLRATGTSMGKTYDSYTTIASGTSMACPHVSGACALILAAYPNIDVNELEQTLLASTDPIAPEICQSGRLNLYKSLLGVVKPQGIVRMQSEVYSCSSNIEIWLADSDLLSNATQKVTVTTSGGDSETIIPTEIPAGIGVFSGTITTSSADPNNEDGILQVMHGQTITASYEDANDGTGSPAVAADTATVDCQGPVILNVQIDIPGPEPTVTIETDEPSKASVWCGLSCEDPNLIIRSHSILSTYHSIKLLGVSPQIQYFFLIEAEDAVGNTTLDNNEGQCYNFTTTVPGDINVPADYLTIQEAIDHSWDNGTVWVADGVYTGDGNRDIDFKGKSITVRSENGPENCIVDCNATSTGFYFHSSESPNSVLDGFTITNGCGRRVCVQTNCSRRGGGIYCSMSSPVIKNCIITNNTAYYGGGVTFDSGSAEFTNCIIKSNSSDVAGGVYALSDVEINNCIITNNYASDGGGGVSGSKLRITNCVIAENSTGIWASGGGITAHYTISDNIITNCTIVNNSAGRRDGRGGGIFVYNSDTTITNCIVRGNSAEYDNPIGNQIAMWSWGIATANISYSNVQGGESAVYSNRASMLNWGPGNIDMDSPFIDPAPDEYSYHLLNDSPCIDAGTNTPAGGLPPTDGDGNPRIVDGDNDGTADVDMGSFEYDPCTMPPVILCIPAEFEFITPLGINPADQVLSIRNGGNSILNWSIVEDCPWLDVLPFNGESSGEIDEVVLSVDVSGLSIGMYSYSLNISSNNAIYSPIEVDIKLYVTTTICVPSDYPTIQAAIDSITVDNFIVMVADGLYTGEGNTDINFNGKNITLRSENGPENCTIDCQNISRAFIFNNGESSHAVLDGFTIINGFADDGGGIYCNQSNPVIRNCVITNNSTSDDGGGIYSNDCSPVVIDCLFRGNSTKDFGGAICAWGQRIKISNCIFENNSAERGGGIMYQSCKDTVIKNCLFCNNSASSGGGIGYQASKDYNMTITNCTFIGNSESAVYLYWSTATMTNSILWDNSGYDINLTQYINPVDTCISKITVYYTDLQGGITAVRKESKCILNWGVGNIDSAPCFVDINDNDYHLLWDSPCIDSGDPIFVAEPNEKDIDGEPRIMGANIDMGFDEVGGKQADFNHNGIIDHKDVEKFIRAWLSNPGEDNWYILCDLYPDDKIDCGDWAELAKDWLWQADWYEP